MKNVLRTFAILLLLTCASGVANAGIIIVNRDPQPPTKAEQPCTSTDKVDLGTIITNVTGIIITNLTGIIITNANDPGQTNCGIIIIN